jgi:DNA-binding NarL/FixJ family response regulator
VGIGPESRIIELIEQGLSTKEIAEKLIRSPLTINTHRSNIIKKTGKSTITEVMRDLKASGLLQDIIPVGFQISYGSQFT